MICKHHSSSQGIKHERLRTLNIKWGWSAAESHHTLLLTPEVVKRVQKYCPGRENFAIRYNSVVYCIRESKTYGSKEIKFPNNANEFNLFSPNVLKPEFIFFSPECNLNCDSLFPGLCFFVPYFPWQNVYIYQYYLCSNKSALYMIYCKYEDCIKNHSRRRHNTN